MRVYMRQLLIIFLLIISVSCTSVLNIYQSTSFVPNKVNDSFSDLTLIKWPKRNYLSIAVLAGIDSFKTNTSSYYYVCLAPSRYGRATSIDDVILNLAVPLQPNEVKQLLTILSNAINKWDLPVTDTSAIVYDFKVTPDDKVLEITEDVNYIYPSFHFYFIRNDDDTDAFIRIGESPSIHTYIDLDKSTIINFHTTLSLALSHLNNLGYKE